MRQRHHFADKSLYSQSYGFSSSHVWMYNLNYKEIWAPKNWWFLNVMLEKSLKSPLDCKEIKPVNLKGNGEVSKSPLDCKEIKPVNLKGNQLWIFIETTDAATEAAILWPLDSNTQFIKKDPDAGKYWRQNKRAAEDEMAR